MSKEVAIKTANQLVTENLDRIAQIASARIRPERLAGIALALYNGDPKLKACSPVSLIRAIAACAAAGVEPNVGANSQCYFIPYGNQVQFQLSYMGLIQVILRGGDVRKIHANVVFEGDDFNWVEGSFPSITHKPGKNTDAATPTHVYAVATLKSGDTLQTVLTAGQVERRHNASRQKNSEMWTKWFESAWKKCAVRDLSKYLPIDYDASQALSADENADLGIRSGLLGDLGDEEVFENRTDALNAKLQPKKPIDITPEPEEPGSNG